MIPTNAYRARVTARTHAIFFAIATLIALSWTSDAFAQSTHCADVNGDGSVSTVDALMVLRRSVGTPIDFNCPSPQTSISGAPSMEAGGCGDVNGDGKTSTLDALIILRFSIGVQVEIVCATPTQARNLVRYLNYLVCQEKVFESTATEFPSMREWKSVSGVESEYQEWNDEFIGQRFVVTIGDCGEVELFGPIRLPANVRVLMRLQLGGLFGNSPELAFFDEGPIDGAAHSQGEREPLAVLTGPAVAGLSAGAGD